MAFRNFWRRHIYIKKEVDTFYFIFIVVTSFSFIMGTYFLFMCMIVILYFEIAKNKGSTCDQAD